MISKKDKILNNQVSSQINSILRKVVINGTASLSDVDGYEVGGKTGTAQIVENGLYSNKKINTFASIFPISNPKYVLVVFWRTLSFLKIMYINIEIKQDPTKELHLIQLAGRLLKYQEKL